MLFGTKELGKMSSPSKEKILVIFVKIVENWKPLGYYYKCTIHKIYFAYLFLNYWNY
jgi:hypothetical protein